MLLCHFLSTKKVEKNCKISIYYLIVKTVEKIEKKTFLPFAVYKTKFFLFVCFSFFYLWTKEKKYGIMLYVWMMYC